jgi:GGDEF domain-containing protein
VGQRINSVCLGLEVATHLGGGEFSVMLPSTDGAGAVAFADGLDAALKNGPIFQGTERVLVAMGAASIPETCDEPEVLMAAARQAKEMSKGGPVVCVLFPVTDEFSSM